MIDDDGKKNSHPKHFLDTTQSELFEAFKQEFSDVKICQRMFERLCPFFVCINNVRETSYWRNHIEFNLNLQSYKKGMARINLNLVIPTRTMQFVKSILCDILEDSDEFKI